MDPIRIASTFLDLGSAAWSADWAWGLPLIVLTVILHVSGLGLFSQRVVHGNLGRRLEHRHPRITFLLVVGGTTLFATTLHGFEAGIWAAAYRGLGAFSDSRSAMLYSLNAMTSYGHTNLQLPDHWHLMGALEALNGWLLFGLSAAFLFAVIQKVWSLDAGQEHQ